MYSVDTAFSRGQPVPFPLSPMLTGTQNLVRRTGGPTFVLMFCQFAAAFSCCNLPSSLRDHSRATPWPYQGTKSSKIIQSLEECHYNQQSGRSIKTHHTYSVGGLARKRLERRSENQVGRADQAETFTRGIFIFIEKNGDHGELSLN